MQDTSKMTPKELMNYRIQLVRDAQAFQKPDRIAINANMFNWMFLDAGYTVAKAYRDYKAIDDSLVKFVEKYKVDSINQLHTGFRNIFQLCDALGGSTVYSSEEDVNMNAISEDVIHADEYEELTNDFTKTMWTKALPRLFPKVKEMTPKEFAEASRSLQDYLDARNYSETKLQEKYGIIVDAVPCLSPGFESLFNFFRGIKCLSLDLRRHKDQVAEYCRVRDELLVGSTLQALKEKGDGWDMSQPYDVCLVMLGNSIVNRKQFDQYYAAPFEKVLDYCAEHNKQAFIYAEGSWERFGDFFNKYPKGVCNMMVEQDDPYVLREKFPNLCLYGGLDVNLMGKEGAQDECVAMAKKAIDELGRDGGLILMPNKMVSYPFDMNSDNLKAVCDFVTTYEI